MKQVLGSYALANVNKSENRTGVWTATLALYQKNTLAIRQRRQYNRRVCDSTELDGGVATILMREMQRAPVESIWVDGEKSHRLFSCKCPRPFL